MEDLIKAIEKEFGIQVEVLEINLDRSFNDVFRLYRNTLQRIKNREMKIFFC